MSPQFSLSRSSRAVRKGALLCAASAALLALSACTPPAPAPQVSDAPELTTEPVRIAAVLGDDDALLQARASASTLRHAGFDAELTHSDGLSASDALAALAAHQVDIVFGGSQAWAQGVETTTPGESGTVASSSAASSAPASPPSDQQGAVNNVSERLSSALAVGTVAVRERTLVVATSKAEAAAHTLSSVGDLAAYCPEATLVAPRAWVSVWSASWGERSGCEPKAITNVGNPASVAGELLRGDAQLGVLHSDDPRLTLWGLSIVEGSSGSLGADPVLGLISTSRVGQDALDKLNKVSSALSGEEWVLLQRLQAEGGVTDQDLGRWLVQRSLVPGDGKGNPATPTPATSSKG